MDHQQIAKYDVVARYVLGRLAPEEEENFEEHLIECPECRREVEREEDFRASLQTVAAEEAVRAIVRVGVIAWLARRSTLRGLLAAALLLLAVLPLWLFHERSRLQEEIGELRVALASPRPAPPAPVPASSTPAPNTGAAERAALQADLAAQQEANARLSDRLDRLTRPQINVPIFSLGLLRGEEGTANRVELGREPRWIVLAVELPPLPADSAKSYRATLAAAGGKTVWDGEGLIPNADGTVTISLYSDRLAPGSYRLRLTAVDAQGKAAPAGEIPLQVVR
jgi:Putative zinc-finger